MRLYVIELPTEALERKALDRGETGMIEITHIMVHDDDELSGHTLYLLSHAKTSGDYRKNVDLRAQTEIFMLGRLWP